MYVCWLLRHAVYVFAYLPYNRRARAEIMRNQPVWPIHIDCSVLNEVCIGECVHVCVWAKYALKHMVDWRRRDARLELTPKILGEPIQPARLRLIHWYGIFCKYTKETSEFGSEFSAPVQIHKYEYSGGEKQFIYKTNSTFAYNRSNIISNSNKHYFIHT